MNLLRNTCLLLLLFGFAKAQQYPWFTQYRSNMYMFNPGFCGTKRTIDARFFYRNQWTGFEGAPKTACAAVNFRYLKGKLGTGFFVFQDNIGPFRTNNISGTFAYHLKMEDIEISFGAQGNYISQTFIGTKVTLHNQIDKTINQMASDKAKTYDGSAGLLIYNERFFLGFGALNFIGRENVFYKNSSFYSGKYKNEPAISMAMGYNFAENPDFIFENSMLTMYTAGAPFYLDFTMRMHVYNAFFTGFSVRLKDAIALHAGFTINNRFQVGYSYDIVTSPLRKYQSGSHEIKIIFSSNLGKDTKRRGINGKFLNQKFQYLL